MKERNTKKRDEEFSRQAAKTRKIGKGWKEKNIRDKGMKGNEEKE